MLIILGIGNMILKKHKIPSTGLVGGSAQVGDKFIHVVYQKHNPKNTSKNYYIVCFSWFAPYVADQIKNFPNDRTIYCCNSFEEVNFVRNLGRKAILCSESAINTSIDTFCIKNQNLQYNAIYNAGMMRWKNHLLAKGVPNLGMVYYPKILYYEKELRIAMPESIWINELNRNREYQRLTPSQVAKVINKSRVGLCLSEVEGCNLVSVEYLLCGIPVVSVQNKGGRDVFYDDAFAITVPPNEKKVEEAVCQLINRNHDRSYIREATLLKLKNHRDRLKQAVDDMLGIDVTKITFQKFHKKSRIELFL